MIRADFTPADAYKYVTFVANESVKTERKKVLAELQFSDNVTSPVTDGAEVDDNIGNRA